MKTLYRDDFICAIHGASFLASGGGGSKRLALRYPTEYILSKALPLQTPIYWQTSMLLKTRKSVLLDYLCLS